jgi:hypothetical protein
MAGAAQRHERSGDEGCLVDRRLVAFLEPPREPPCRHAGMTLWILDGDQRRQLQRLHERDAADLPQQVLSDQEVASLDRSSEGCPRVPLGGQFAFPRPDGAESLATTRNGPVV